MRQPRDARADLKQMLEHADFEEGNTTRPGDFVIERAFVEKMNACAPRSHRRSSGRCAALVGMPAGAGKSTVG